MEGNVYLDELEGTAVFQVKDPMSALTHFIGFCAALTGSPLLLIRGAMAGVSFAEMVSLAIFMFSMVLLYGASTSYHSFHISERADLVLKKLDHMMIFILIAGSYTPVCVIALKGFIGNLLLALVWGVAAAGILFKAFWVNCPKWVSSIIYISMGWLALLAIVPLYHNLPGMGFFWLVLGGIIYTIGGVVYAMKLSFLSEHFEGFGAHELFHVFVMLGSLCHFIMVFYYMI